jgi:hypothetical protein
MMARDNGKLDIGSILANSGKGEGPLQLMFSRPGQPSQPTDWRIVLIQVCSSIDQNTFEIKQVLDKIEKGVNNGASEKDSKSEGDGAEGRGIQVIH